MRRRFVVGVALGLLLTGGMVARPAAAVEIYLLRPIPNFFSTDVPIGPGDSFTIELVIRHASAEPIVGLGLSVHGYGNNLEFVSGEAVGNYFNAICVDIGCFGGLQNLAGMANGNRRTLGETSIGAFGPRVQFALSAQIPGAENFPNIDPGLDGEVGSAMFRMTFRVLEGASGFNLFIDSSYTGDQVFLTNGRTTEAVFLGLVPEPSTAILLGLGLAGLAANRRSSSGFIVGEREDG